MEGTLHLRNPFDPNALSGFVGADIPPSGAPQIIRDVAHGMAAVIDQLKVRPAVEQRLAGLQSIDLRVAPGTAAGRRRPIEQFDMIPHAVTRLRTG